MTRSLPRLIIHLTALALMVAGAAIAITSRSDADEAPPAKPLAQAVGEALSAPAPAGVSGRFEFSNRLVDAAAIPSGGDNPLLSGATGRFWIARGGRARLALESPAGDAQISLDGDDVELYDPGSNTVYTGRLPSIDGLDDEGGPGELQRMLRELTRAFTLSEARPGTVADRAAYTVRISPRHDGGLLGAAEVAWDAANGLPLRAAVYAQGEREPVLEVEATELELGPVAEADLALRRPAGAKEVEIEEAAAQGDAPRVGGRAAAKAVQARLPFELSAPAAVAGLPRRSIRTLRMGDATGALVTYGKGLGALAVIQLPAHGGGLEQSGARGLQELSIDGTTAFELATALGTVVQFERDGVSYTVVGSVPPAAAEAAARSL
jgi:outer membrane lipoprotein-sorting protein